MKDVSSEDQLIIDNKLIELDATENKSKLGANAILSISLACARAASNSMKISLYEYLNIMYKGYIQQKFHYVTSCSYAKHYEWWMSRK